MTGSFRHFFAFMVCASLGASLLQACGDAAKYDVDTNESVAVPTAELVDSIAEKAPDGASTAAGDVFVDALAYHDVAPILPRTAQTVETHIDTTFDDVAGVSEAKQALVEFVRLVNDAPALSAQGIRPSRGILMVGAPGTGKTLLARATAQAADAAFFSVSGTDLLLTNYGEQPTQRLHDLFEQARAEAPSIIFIDELDALALNFGLSKQLGIEMDGFVDREGVYVIAASNTESTLDPSLLRSGRFDQTIHVPMPNAAARKAILAMRTAGKPIFSGIDLDAIARQTTRMSGADLGNLANTAALRALRAGHQVATMVDFDEAQDDIQIGHVTHDAKASPDMLRAVAVHEAGHAAVALLTGESPNKLHRVTIVPRGQTGGHTRFAYDEAPRTQTASDIRNTIAIGLGARAAETLVYGQPTSGVYGDLQHITMLARAMVMKLGMGPSVGPVFTGPLDTCGPSIYGATLTDAVNDDVRRILDEEAARAATLLADNRDKLGALTDALLVCGALSGEQARQVFWYGAPPGCANALQAL